MDKFETLKLNKEFRYLYGRGKSEVMPTVVVYAKKNKLGFSRLGITSGKKIGKAVQRNRARRLIRVAFRALLPEFNDNYDMVIVARTRTTFSDSNKVTFDLKQCLIKIGVINEKGN